VTSYNNTTSPALCYNIKANYIHKTVALLYIHLIGSPLFIMNVLMYKRDAKDLYIKVVIIYSTASGLNCQLILVHGCWHEELLLSII
jgi:hypothetical protein